MSNNRFNSSLQEASFAEDPVFVYEIPEVKLQKKESEDLIPTLNKDSRAFKAFLDQTIATREPSDFKYITQKIQETKSAVRIIENNPHLKTQFLENPESFFPELLALVPPLTGVLEDRSNYKADLHPYYADKIPEIKIFFECLDSETALDLASVQSKKGNHDFALCAMQQAIDLNRVLFEDLNELEYISGFPKSEKYESERHKHNQMLTQAHGILENGNEGSTFQESNIPPEIKRRINFMKNFFSQVLGYQMLN